ncbi:MAG: NUDIX domain-containing protein [Prolixibacteraceae bacterium]|nr:NUDIX domain-containing protein [Prolixibacteraceae bacterium]MBN2774382.1 NUDIX domain-containing protein [Prolixibacteraceae bacterium]
MPGTQPIKVLKFCPRCGSGDFPTESERSFKCGECGFHFFINSSTAVAALIFNIKGELLFTRRAIEPHLGKLDLPGGFVDPGESAEEALIRELKEELGIKVEDLNYFASAPNEYIYSGFSVYTLDLAFFAEIESLDGLKPMDDISGYEFIKPENVDFLELPAKSMQYFVKELIKSNDRNKNTDKPA